MAERIPSKALLASDDASEFLGHGRKRRYYLNKLEQQGKLTPIRLTGPRGQKHYRIEELLAIVNGEASDAQ